MEQDDLDAADRPTDEQPSDEPAVGDVAAFEPTGHDGVDRVLAALEGIEQRTVHEHVAVFEQTHTGLRQALDCAERE